jgi:hypothetical protein
VEDNFIVLHLPCNSSINTDFTTKQCALVVPNRRIFRCSLNGRKHDITTDVWMRSVTWNIVNCIILFKIVLKKQFLTLCPPLYILTTNIVRVITVFTLYTGSFKKIWTSSTLATEVTGPDILWFFSYGDTLKTMPTNHKLQDRIRAAVQTIEGEQVSQQLAGVRLSYWHLQSKEGHSHWAFVSWFW